MVEVGAHVTYRGQTWQVAALQGQQVYLLQETGAEVRLLLGRLFADPGFEVVGARAPDAVPQWGLFETVPVAAQQRALAWLPHIREVETGWPHPEGGRDSQTMRPQYDPERWTLAQRDAAKAQELAALGFARVTPTTVQRMRHSYRKQGLWGLVDKRVVPARGRHPTGYADERVVAAVLEAMRRQRGRSKGTVKGLQVLVRQILEDTHGRGVVEMPSRSTFYRLVSVLADPADRPGRPARTATAPARASSAPVVLRPGSRCRSTPPAWTSWPSSRTAAWAAGADHRRRRRHPLHPGRRPAPAQHQSRRRSPAPGRDGCSASSPASLAPVTSLVAGRGAL